MRANEVMDEIKQCEEFHYHLIVLVLNNCGLIGVFDACSGGIDKIEYSTILDSDVVKVHRRGGRRQIAEQESEGKFNDLACDSGTSTGIS